MFKVLANSTICLTRGDAANLKVTANNGAHTFQTGDVIRFVVFRQKACGDVVIQKDVTVEEETPIVYIPLDPEDTLFGDLIHEPVEYWYSIKLNPDAQTQTLVGYDDYGAKVFRLYPGGGAKA